MPNVWVIAGAGLICALGLLAGTAAAAAPQAAASANTLSAVWKEQRFDFFYMGRTARYSCEGLRDKMRALLLELGARRDLTVSAIGCDETAPQLRSGSLPNLHILFSAPALPDAEAQPLLPGDLRLVEARYQPFTLTGDAFRNLGIGDCELVEEFARQVLPKFATRGVKKDITCVPYQLSGSRFFVRGETLRAVAKP
jgi:hypothetical protein